METAILREVVKLLNTWDQGYETALLEKFADWCNLNLVCIYKIVPNEQKTKWMLREK